MRDKMFGYHLFKFDIYELAESYSYFLTKILKKTRNTKDDDTAKELCHFFDQFVMSTQKKNKYDKNKIKKAFLSCYKNPEKDVEELFDCVADGCCNYENFNSSMIWDKLGDINGF